VTNKTLNLIKFYGYVTICVPVDYTNTCRTIVKP